MFLKKHIRQHISFSVLGSLIAFVNLPLLASEPLSEKYQKAENAFEKKQILREICAQQKNSKSETSAPASRSSASALRSSAAPAISAQDVATIKEALKEKNATIVSEAINCTAALKISGLDDSLANMYNSADQRYDGYAERVKISIIQAMGSNRSSSTDRFITNLLEQSKGDHLATAILRAIGETEDPSFLSPLQQFRNRMEGKLQEYKKKNSNPIVYSEIESNIKLALEIENSISKENGGRK